MLDTKTIQERWNIGSVGALEEGERSGWHSAYVQRRRGWRVETGRWCVG